MEALPLGMPHLHKRRITHLDDAGRCLDRCRILLTAALEELMAAEHLAPEAGQLASRIERLRAEVVTAWERLPEPELPLT